MPETIGATQRRRLLIWTNIVLSSILAAHARLRSA